MMKHIDFECYKVAAKLPLAVFRSYLGVKQQPHRSEYLEIKGGSLAQVMKYGKEEQSVFLFSFGCVTFVQFSPDEIRLFLHFMDALMKPGRNSALAGREALSFDVSGEGLFRLREQDAEEMRFSPLVVPTLAAALAKLTALSAMEEDVLTIFDEAESFVDRMQRGRLNIRAVKYAKEMAKILRFQYDSAYCIRIFERCDLAEQYLESRVLFDRFMEEHQYRQRIQVLQQKTDALHRTFDTFLTLSQNWQENRELYIEIALLAIFPFFYL